MRSGGSLHAFGKARDVRFIGQDDIHDWAKHRRDVDHIGPGTAYRHDLVAAAMPFSWTMTRGGGRLRADNPVSGVKLEPLKGQTLLEGTFRHDEIKTTVRQSERINVAGNPLI